MESVLFDPVNVLWTAIAGIVALLVAARAWSRHREPQDSSIGFVSARWLAEQRLNRPDSER